MSKCKSCYYHDLSVGSCDYLLLTGNRRGCEAEGCDKWFPRTKRRLDTATPGWSPNGKRQRMYNVMQKLYDQGLNDRQIAEKIGCSFKTVANWRSRNKLLPLSKGGRPRKEYKNGNQP